MDQGSGKRHDPILFKLWFPADVQTLLKALVTFPDVLIQHKFTVYTYIM